MITTAIYSIVSLNHFQANICLYYCYVCSSWLICIVSGVNLNWLPMAYRFQLRSSLIDKPISITSSRTKYEISKCNRWNSRSSHGQPISHLDGNSNCRDSECLNQGGRKPMGYPANYLRNNNKKYQSGSWWLYSLMIRQMYLMSSSFVQEFQYDNYLQRKTGSKQYLAVGFQWLLRWSIGIAIMAFCQLQ